MCGLSVPLAVEKVPDAASDSYASRHDERRSEEDHESVNNLLSCRLVFGNVALRLIVPMVAAGITLANRMA